MRSNMARQGSLPQRTTSRRREPGPLSDSEQRAKAQHIDKVHERLRSRGLQPREPRDMGLGNQFDCQFNSVMLALLHPMIAGAMRPAPQGRREQPNADTAKQQRKKVKQWCYDNGAMTITTTSPKINPIPTSPGTQCSTSHRCITKARLHGKHAQTSMHRDRRKITSKIVLLAITCLCSRLPTSTIALL